MSSNKHIKVYLSDLAYLQSDGNYTYLYTAERKIAQKKSLTKVLSELDNRFIRCHRTYAVNKYHVISWSSTEIKLMNNDIPLGRSYQKLFEYEMGAIEKNT